MLHALLNISAGFGVQSHLTQFRADFARHSLAIETLEHAVCLIARLTFDVAAITDCVVSTAIEDVLATLVSSIPEANREASVSMT